MFIQKCLSNRVFRVPLGSVYSNIHEQEMGVHQGSIFSVTLFISKINSIANVIPSSFEKSLFVDDFSSSCSSRNMASIEKQLQLCLNKVEKWADENGFIFSKTKTVCMHFCNKRKSRPNINNIQFTVLLVSHILRNWNPFKTWDASGLLQCKACMWSQMNIRFDKLCVQYALKLRSNPDNPAYDVVLTPSIMICMISNYLQ